VNVNVAVRVCFGNLRRDDIFIVKRRPSEEDDLKRENANINADTAMGTMLKYGSESAKAFYDKYVIHTLCGDPGIGLKNGAFDFPRIERHLVPALYRALWRKPLL